MKKTELAALVNTLRTALDDARMQRQHAEAATQRAEMEKQAAFAQLRRLEHQRATPFPPITAAEHSIQMEDSRYRPAREGETPDILVTDVRPGHEAARDLPYVRI